MGSGCGRLFALSSLWLIFPTRVWPCCNSQQLFARQEPGDKPVPLPGLRSGLMKLQENTISSEPR